MAGFFILCSFLLAYNWGMAYSPRRDESKVWTIREGDRFFRERGLVNKTLHRIAKDLARLDIPYAVVGGLALFKHGYHRYTEDVDLLVTREGLKRIHEELEGRGYLPKFRGSKNLRNTETGVTIEFLVAGEFPGDGKDKPVAFPDPKIVSHESDGILYLNLESLIELKLASGMTSRDRIKDTADIHELIKALRLPREFGERLNPYVRKAYDDLWLAGDHPKRYVLLWQAGDSAVGGKSIEEIARIPGEASEELRKMAEDGVRFERNGEQGDQLLFVTEDPEVAAKYDMHEESEFL